MTASVHIFKPRKLMLVTPSDRLSKRQLTAKVMRISKAQAKAKKAVITYPPELLPVPNLGVEVDVVIKCNRPDCIGEGCKNCEVRKL